jgi:S1-C subfamily serine protease
MRLRVVCAALFLVTALSSRAPAQGLPAAIGPDAVRQTKQATVYIKVTSAAGDVAEGSGFLAVEPGIVVTNAHVVGMLRASSKPPKRIDVVVRSGEPDELSLSGKVLGVDRANDLAVLKVEGKLPTPLQLGLKDELFETQKVYIFGFPFGAKLGKAITVSESSISSLRKDASGALEKIQVNGGMHPGNSGGPVVNALGQVVGVSVAGIPTTHINFAIPARSVKTLLEGGIQEVKAGELFRAKDQVRVPLEIRTLDPFGRIREIRVETWTGVPASNRPFSTAKALPQKGDGPRTSQALKPVEAVAAGDVLVPKAAPGQVAWVQPVLVFAKGEVWGTPTAYDPALALERVPAELTIKLAEQKERTVHLKTTQLVVLRRGKLSLVIAEGAELDVLESFEPDAKGTRIRLGFGAPKLTVEEDGKKHPVSPEIAGLLQRVPPSFVIDDTNKMRQRTDINLNPKLPALLREQVGDFLAQVSNGYEASTFILPNRQLAPREAWNVQLPMMMKLGDKKVEILDLVLVCIYEGARAKGDAAEAVISFSGKVQGRGLMKDKVAGDVAGKFTFDLKRTFIQSVRMTISSDAASSGGELEAHFAFNIDLSRIEGNPHRLELPKLASTPPAVKGDILLSKNGALTPRDPLDKELGGRGSRVQLVPVELERGKKYTILLTSSAFDCYLRLIDPAGAVVAHDDDSGGGLNSRIDHVAVRRGRHQIVVTSFDGKAGPFQLQVLADKGKAIAKADDGKGGKDDPKTRLDLPLKGFDKPARSAAPTSYLKIVSSPGDYIGQGKTYEYSGEQLVIKPIARGVSVQVDGWRLNIGAPNGESLKPGEYRGAKRFAFSGAAPGLDFSGKGRGSNKIAGEFVVWELELADGRITRLAIDFVQHSEEKGPPLRGKLRFNSTLE